MGIEQMSTTIWKPNSRGYLSAGASLERLDAAEKRLGVRLPSNLRHAYQQQDGGFLALGCFRRETTESVPDAFYLKNDPLERVDDFRTLSEASEEGWNIDSHRLDQLIIVMQGGARFWCLDYRRSGGNGEPSITYFNAEMNEEVSVAPSWDAFCDGLADADPA